MVKNLPAQCSRPRFNPWVEKIPWRREWQHTPIFLLGKFHGEIQSISRKESDTTEQLTLSHFIPKNSWDSWVVVYKEFKSWASSFENFIPMKSTSHSNLFVIHKININDDLWSFLEQPTCTFCDEVEQVCLLASVLTEMTRGGDDGSHQCRARSSSFETCWRDSNFNSSPFCWAASGMLLITSKPHFPFGKRKIGFPDLSCLLIL